MNHTLIEFLTEKMSMTEVYQPVIIKELLENHGKCTKQHLALVLAKYDLSVVDYYQKILMRWPKETLTKHNIIIYDKKEKLFVLNPEISNIDDARTEIKICDQKIAEWLEKRGKTDQSPQVNESLRYAILKMAKGKCQLCGISSSIRPMDIDHIVPQSMQNKEGKVKKDNKWINVHSAENLQALCFKCNRAKRDTDTTDFRRTKKLVRDNIPDIIRCEGRNPSIKELKGSELLAALEEKLIEEHEEFIAAPNKENSVSELADMLEVIFAISKFKGFSREQLLIIVEEKRKKKGGFEKGYFYKGDVT